MKRNILMLTNIYPAPDSKLLNTTAVCHYFTKKWVEQGYSVKVIFNYPIYTKVLHSVAKLFEKSIANKYATYVSTTRHQHDYFYELDGVSVARFPMYKHIPKVRYSDKIIKKQTNKIQAYLEKEKFNPDYIIGHFHTPSLELVSELKKKYEKAISCVVAHGKADNLISFYGEKAYKMVEMIDVWGYRSQNIKENFEKLYGKQKKSFLCYSGIPEEFLFGEVTYRKTLYNFVYVGSLIKRKYPQVIIPALMKAFPDKKFKLSFIGDGTEKRQIEKQIKQFGLKENVNLLGHIKRKDVVHHLEKADCFIMISENESFGLVYLEAMAKGCITIASKNEGMDGIITNGENGFLCEAGNIENLSKQILEISNLKEAEKEKISLKATETAKKLTDKNVAEEYMQNLLTHETK